MRAITIKLNLPSANDKVMLRRRANQLGKSISQYLWDLAKPDIDQAVAAGVIKSLHQNYIPFEDDRDLVDQDED